MYKGWNYFALQVDMRVIIPIFASNLKVWKI